MNLIVRVSVVPPLSSSPRRVLALLSAILMMVGLKTFWVTIYSKPRF